MILTKLRYACAMSTTHDRHDLRVIGLR